MENSIFRSALNGFNRQDVMAYIERTQKEAEEKTAELESRAEELQNALDATREELDSCTAEREEMAAKLEEMTAHYEEAKVNWQKQDAERESLRGELGSRDGAVKDLTAENQRLFHRVEDMEAEVTAARREKEQVAQLELEARQRCDAVLTAAQENAARIGDEAAKAAAATLEEANAQAEEILKTAEDQVSALLAKYSGFFEDFDTAAAHITNELRRMDVVVSQLPLSCNHLRQDLSELGEMARER